MKIYVLFDKVSKSFINVFLSENVDTALRSVRCMVENFVAANNSGAIIQMKDCSLVELKDFVENKIVDIKDIIKTGEKKVK